MTELLRAIRGLMRAPGLSAIAIVSLALGIGANSAIFSVYNTLALRTLAVPDPDRLAGLHTIKASGERGNVAYADFEEIRARQQSFSSLFVWDDSAVRTFEVNGGVFAGTVLMAGEGFAETMRMRPVIGRGIAKGDTQVAVLGYQCWRRYFHGGVHALGKTIRIQGKDCIIIGVAPEYFTNMEGSRAVEAIAPLAAFAPGNRLRENRGEVWDITGRLKPGISLTVAGAELDALWRQIGRNSRSRLQVDPPPAEQVSTSPDGASHFPFRF